MDFPRHGFSKIKCDGASNNVKDAEIGGIIRVDNGGFQACLARHIYKNDNNVAEVWEIREGLLLEKNIGIKKLEVETDSTYAVQLCKRETSTPWVMRSLIKDIEELMLSFDDIVIGQRYREANGVADYLAKSSVAKEIEGEWITSPPTSILRLLSNDLVGRAVVRNVRLSA